MIKSGFWWLIRAPDSQFSGYRVFEGQNWIKIVVFCIFEFWPYMVLISVNTTTKIVKNGFVLKKNPMDCFKNWHAILIWHGIDVFTDHFFILFVWRLFFTFFHFFKVLKKEFFRISSNWVLFTASVTRTILSRFKNSGLDF